VTTEVLLSGAVGALIVFLLGAFREWWREEREREGLLRLLLAESDHNAEVIRTIGEGTDDLLGSEDFTKVSTDTWRDVQGRAAALLPDDLFATLNVYYSPLQTLLTLRAFENSVSEREVRAGGTDRRRRAEATLVAIGSDLCRMLDMDFRERLHETV
jgi:hypothetical protein